MKEMPNYAVVLTESAPGKTGTIAYTDDGAAIAGSIESAKRMSQMVRDFMGWHEDDVEIMEIDLSPVTSPVDKGPQQGD